ncbi:MAG: ribose-phosphate diphosphokinase [Alphaproteobacteria bacterium]|nr:ribose-phosphate diphosphokinase [Alphaproteobacteria bacterium]
MLFNFPKTSSLGQHLQEKLNAEEGRFLRYSFPDGETYLRIESDVKGREIFINATLFHPNSWILDLLFLADTLRTLEAKSIKLIAPYLSYMRQDKVFQEGEALTSKTFSHLLSAYFDALITVDPHLHRYHCLSQIYTIPTTVLQAAPLISEWIHENVENPFLIGPDEESRQWVQEVAGDLPFIVLQKERNSQGQVKISWPSFKGGEGKTPVFVDDIISSGGTMLLAIEQAKALGLKLPVIVAIHPIFANDSYEKLKNAGVLKIVTCNSIPHSSNVIDLAPLIVSTLK